jgi:monofunctional biosynthetic peptidoglycan transglycosylase
LPKRREAVDPAGFTRRYGANIQRRMAYVARERLDACVYD